MLKWEMELGSGNRQLVLNGQEVTLRYTRKAFPKQEEKDLMTEEKKRYTDINLISLEKCSILRCDDGEALDIYNAEYCLLVLTIPSKCGFSYQQINSKIFFEVDKDDVQTIYDQYGNYIGSNSEDEKLELIPDGTEEVLARITNRRTGEAKTFTVEDGYPVDEKS